jgi:hypothetical protein
MSFGREVPGEEWTDETCCPNCRGSDIIEFGYKVGGKGRACLECRDCGAYSTWRTPRPETPNGAPHDQS